MVKVKNNLSAHQATQPIDSLTTSVCGSGEDKGKCGDELAFMKGTEQFEENAWINDQYMDTQVIDLECDNEDFTLCVETQALNLGSEIPEGKHLLETSDGLATQLLDEIDDEVVADSDDDVTDVLEDNIDLSDSDDSCSKAETLLSSDDYRQHCNQKTESTGARVSCSKDHGVSEKVARFASVRSAAFRASAMVASFPSVRSAAFRASAMVARVATQKLSGSDCFTECSFREVRNQQCPPSIYVEKKHDLQTGNRTARKLFLDDSPVENFPSVGLSYIDSQEPGEESEANALNLVDKLISESCLEFAHEVQNDCGRRIEDKEKFVPSVKGPQELAKKLSYKRGVVGNGTFDWDDSREDEGGGDFYRRRKEEFFGVTNKARESSTLPRARERGLIHESHRGLSVAVDKCRAHSDSRLLQHSAISRKKIQAAKKNLGKELAEVLKESNNEIFDMREVAVLGNDTQVAAEALGALCSGDHGKKLSPEKDRGFSNYGVITRQSKGAKRIHAMGKGEILKRRMKKGSPIPSKVFGKNIKRSSKGSQLEKESPCCSKKRKAQTASRETKKNLVDKLDEVSKKSNTRMFDKHDEVEVGADTQLAAEAINALHSGDSREIDPEPNCLIGKKLSPEGGISSHGVVTRKSKRIKGIEAVDNGVESLKPKTKKARSILAKACEKNMDRYSKNDKSDTLDEVVVSSTKKRRGESASNHCTSKLLKQSSRGEAEVLSFPKRRRSARISQDQVNNEAGRSSDPAFDTPIKSKVSSKNVSPICMGDEYYKLSSFKSNITRELRSLTSPLAEPILETMSTRKRRDLGSIRVLFSQHLDENVTKHQKKVLARLNISEASSMMEATHFIADNFMRTRNMLEAIASGKPVVTTQWLESIDQVNIYVDEDLYILRDSKKEREFGFNMGVSLSRARQCPLLQGRRVFITSNTKPGLNTITTLVKAVHGLPVERLGRSVLNEDKIPENLLVISCEEDRDICTPFIERGAEVYSSELLLNGIVTQKLEYERYRIFTDNVRKTRSTIWIRDGKGEFQRRCG